MLTADAFFFLLTEYKNFTSCYRDFVYYRGDKNPFRDLLQYVNAVPGLRSG